MAGLMVLAFILNGCGGGTDLAVAGEPLNDALIELQDFGVAIGSGLSNSEILSRWPDVATAVRRDLDDYEPVAELDPLEEALREALDSWQGARDALYEYVREDGPGEQATIRLLEAVVETGEAGQWAEHLFDGGPNPNVLASEREAEAESEEATEQVSETPSEDGGTPGDFEASRALVREASRLSVGFCRNITRLGTATQCDWRAVHLTFQAGLTAGQVTDLSEAGDVVGEDWIIRGAPRGLAQDFADGLGGEVRGLKTANSPAR